MGDWKPIRTAPTDGTVMRLRGTWPRWKEIVEVDGFYEEGGYTEGWVASTGSEFWATEWKPNASAQKSRPGS